jgi:serine/threonine protein kinase
LLRQLNVLIDDSEKAVLCDFGLSRMIADVASRATNVEETPTLGSRNWMAPETFKGGSLKKTSDVYAFGMVIYEVSAFFAPSLSV